VNELKQNGAMTPQANQLATAIVNNGFAATVAVYEGSAHPGGLVGLLYGEVIDGKVENIQLPKFTVTANDSNNNPTAPNSTAQFGSDGFATPEHLAAVLAAGAHTRTASNDTATGPGYWDRYGQHVETYSITLPPELVGVGIVGGSIPKTWVGRQFGPNPLTSVVRGLGGSNAVTTAPIVRQFIVPIISVAGAAVGGYNTGVLLSGLVYAAFPGSNGLPPPPPPPPSSKEPGT